MLSIISSHCRDVFGWQNISLTIPDIPFVNYNIPFEMGLFGVILFGKNLLSDLSQQEKLFSNVIFKIEYKDFNIFFSNEEIEYNFSENGKLRNGPEIGYFEDGSVSHHCNYAYDHRVGEYILYSTDGSIMINDRYSTALSIYKPLYE